MNISNNHQQISPAAQLMAIEIISELLVSTSPQKLGEALTDHLRELTGAKTVMVLAHRSESAEDELLNVSPARRATLFSRTELNNFCHEITPSELPVTLEAFPADHPLHAQLLRAGIHSMMSFQLQAGGELVGLLLLFDLPGVERTAETSHIINLLAAPIALALKNALAFRLIEEQAQELEQRVAERTEELREKNAELLENEKMIQASAMQLRIIANHVPVLIAQCDSQLRYKFVNQSYAEMFGLQTSEIIGKHPRELFGEDVYASASPYMAAALAGQSVEYDLVLPTTQNGPRTIHLSYAPERDDSGKVVGFIAAINDITARKRAEEEKIKLEAQLQQAQKMESVGRLAGGVAHDFNNMLTVILGHAELGLMHLDPAHRVCADLKEISETAQRSADLTRQLLAFARKQTVAPKVIDLNEAVTGMFKMLQRLIGEDIHLVWQPATALWPVKMDPSQIDQILANLCVNARDAIEDTGQITIETENSNIDKEYCAANPEATPGKYVRLTVSDDGGGMNKEMLAHIFEPFYTTKELGKGTGLGLATVYGAVKQNNGFINIYSEPGQGTTFSIYLPRDVESKGSQAVNEDTAVAVPRGQETILLVEDEPAILKIASLMLEKQGYTVLKAATPGEAIRLAREHVGEIQLLMTDVIMPEMNGRDLAKNLLSIYPDMKRLFMSGYTADVIAHHGVLDEGVHFIQKPFSLPNMATMVREVLKSDGGKLYE